VFAVGDEVLSGVQASLCVLKVTSYISYASEAGPWPA
jgi:hypothetical protein